jgi:hypothetical protein
MDQIFLCIIEVNIKQQMHKFSPTSSVDTADFMTIEQFNGDNTLI